jgi:rhodanese-related sulfurtransferase
MNKYLLFTMLIALSISSCSQQNNYSLTADAFEEGLQNANVQLLDVRSAEEFKKGHLKNALQANYNNNKEFIDRIQHLDKAKPIYIYCLSGIRSNYALSILKEKGFTQLYHLKGGINA